ncbi:16S rRNA (uracil1498-N3)-methyltransferase [Amphibacillus marinus]|uniref:Ribosomal RNA small subunit methyltransferase E n=1 Tax=Amphibacillus marinus TaxID=872970 RepID=A0A1H8NR91_9BACI|nr:16S rRNA (uracil(1498)-N(3))-methyltransferase [Amphibacillus marinus]SEO32152.1 16S rRNA (uracil1498-N3)-methyltransferase [Amphibacillus marinus]
MQYYFIDQENWSDQGVIISGDDVHHVVHVMRMTQGDRVVCNHPDGRSAICEIVSFDKEVNLVIIDWLIELVELPVSVTVVQALPKGDKLDWIVQKATELGVNQIVPFQASRSVVKWDKKKHDKKIARLVKIAKEAAEQSHRSRLPVITDLHKLEQLVTLSKTYSHRFIAYEETTRAVKAKKLSQYFNKIKPADSVLIVIGPEGGLERAEVDLLLANQFEPVRFGPRILRTETAAMYALSSLSYYFEETE